MKTIFRFIPILILIWACSSLVNKELYEKTDGFVKSLEKEYDSYGVLGGLKHRVTTSDGLYQITPTGRLINVKILKVVPDEEYEDLRKDLEDHYEGDSRVNEVYRNKGGTITIDCRN